MINYQLINFARFSFNKLPQFKLSIFSENLWESKIKLRIKLSILTTENNLILIRVFLENWFDIYTLLKIKNGIIKDIPIGIDWRIIRKYNWVY